MLPPRDEVISGIIRAQIDARDFLGWQLSHAHGLMTDAELEEIAESYFQKTYREWSDEELSYSVSILCSLVSEHADSELI